MSSTSVVTVTDRTPALHLVVNPSSGPGDEAEGDRVAAVAKSLIDCRVTVVAPGADLSSPLQEAARRGGALGVSGGDGSVSAAASVAVEAGRPLLVVPGGTLNHFAGDLGLDDAEAAFSAFTGGRRASVDVASIGERVFVNNASLGAYPQVVDARERLEGRLGKWVALLVALVVVLHRGRPCDLQIDGRRRRVWLAFFGNGHYDDGGLVPTGRSRLDGGRLDVRLVHADKKFARLRLLGAVLTGSLDRSPVYDQWEAEVVSVCSLAGGNVRVAADGETFDAGSAFEVKIRPGALEVFRS